MHKVAHYEVFWYVLSYYVRNVLKGYFVVGKGYEVKLAKKGGFMKKIGFEKTIYQWYNEIS